MPPKKTPKNITDISKSVTSTAVNVPQVLEEQRQCIEPSNEKAPINKKDDETDSNISEHDDSALSDNPESDISSVTGHDDDVEEEEEEEDIAESNSDGSTPESDIDDIEESVSEDGNDEVLSEPGAEADKSVIEDIAGDEPESYEIFDSNRKVRSKMTASEIAARNRTRIKNLLGYKKIKKKTVTIDSNLCAECLFLSDDRPRNREYCFF